MIIKKYSRWVLLLVILLASIKAIFFTWNLVWANYFFYSNNKENAAAYMYRIVSANPIVYRSFQNAQKNLVEDFLVKKALYAKYRDNKNIFETFTAKKSLKDLSIERFKTLYRDNFYLQYLFPLPPPPPPQSNWENLDPVSLELLADKSLNPLTLSLWEKVKPTVDPEFTTNLADYCRWQGNAELAASLEKNTAAKNFYYPEGPGKSESLKQLLKNIKKKNKLTNENLEEYQPGSEDFNDPATFNKKWAFSAMSGTKDPRAASFTMGLDGTGTGNGCLRLMGFFNGSKDGKTKTTARGGAMRKEKVPISKEYYLLSFDYLTATGRERPSLFLWKGIWEIFLPPTGGKWKKAVCFLNNSTGTYTGIKPFFRMWGTGSVLIDNVYFAAITDHTLNFSRTTVTFISE
ncbi:MAG TPA: hypothetical protein VK186_03490 [Candidatus Deferrimicrobium sp.]|nr:hypothetical protein [Candidatus Deferrimicrobium sp.]